MSKSNILVILTGSIAAYKTCQVLSRLVQAGHEVKVVATEAALNFVGAATLEGLTGNKVHTDLYADGQMMAHIHLARWADLILCAPATANYINKIANGLGDDLASTLFLAHDFTKPFLLAPAMNTSMYLHPLTQKSIQTLKSLKVEILETASGVLACGEQGYGKLLDPDLILQEVLQRLPAKASIQTKIPTPPKSESRKILITAGGTTEAIDSVRTITNTSTGRTGFALAQNLWQFGHQVTLLLSQNAQVDSSHSEFEVQKFTDYKSLKSGLENRLSLEKYDVVFHLAAVSDYSIKEIKADGQTQTSNKIPSGAQLNLELKPNPKIVNELKKLSLNPGLRLVSFKLTSSASNTEADKAIANLMQNSSSDYVVHNDLAEMTDKHTFKVFKKVNLQPSQVFKAENVNALSDFFIQELL